MPSSEETEPRERGEETRPPPRRGRFLGGSGASIRSRAPERIPHRIRAELEEEIVALRKELSEQGLDAGACTIHYHLSKRGDGVPSVSTIWRVLRRRGFVTPQPHKRPRRTKPRP